MIFFRSVNGIVVERVDSLICPNGFWADPKSVTFIGANLKYWDDEWNVITNRKQLEYGLIELPEGFTVDENDNIIDTMNPIERFEWVI